MTGSTADRRRTMVVGIPPDYRYPGSLSAWYADNTRFAANLGACLITNSLLRQFDADYVERFEDVSGLRSRYDTCVLSLATHLNPDRDIWWITNAVEKLGLKTIVLSAGITDYAPELPDDFRLHPSVKRLLEIAASNSKWIGVRGHYSALVLQRAGFANVVPIGCPTLYWGLREDLEIRKRSSFERPLVTYHLTLGRAAGSTLAGRTLLGQDFQDQAAFTDDLAGDVELQQWLRRQFADPLVFEQVQSIVREYGEFLPSFEEWFEFVGRHDFVTGPRLHGCIAGLVQGIPSVMTPRDLRGREIAEFYGLPTSTYEALSSGDLNSIYAAADFSRFNESYPRRFRSFVAFLEENGLGSRHARSAETKLTFGSDDLAAVATITKGAHDRLQERLSSLETKSKSGARWSWLGSGAAKTARRYIARLRQASR
jgi:hypothetical protein